MTIKNLKEKKTFLEDELYDLHFNEPSPKMYLQRRSELEFKIAQLEELINFEQNMKKFKVTLAVFAVVASCLIMYTLIYGW